jgi:hypothetical protein
VNLQNLRPTIVFESYWKFAAERYRVYLKRLAGEPSPWTTDPILAAHKFTNSFRAADRVSQYCIRQVIYESGGSMEPEEVIFRVLLFKLFNSIAAWEVLVKAFGTPEWKSFNAAAYGAELGRAWAKGKGARIWNVAYVQNQNYRTNLVGKHNRYIALLEHMMSSGVTKRLQAAQSYEEAFDVLRSYPLHGKEFIPMQHLTDLNYSPVLNFDEDDFVIPGPGALNGINKCFGLKLKASSQADLIDGASIIKRCVDIQEDEFKNCGLEPVTLFGRRLHLIDCQNLFCETDKYARVAHPQFNLGRSQIKQKLQPIGPLPEPFFPPKWGLKV